MKSALDRNTLLVVQCIICSLLLILIHIFAERMFCNTSKYNVPGAPTLSRDGALLFQALRQPGAPGEQEDQVRSVRRAGVSGAILAQAPGQDEAVLLALVECE